MSYRPDLVVVAGDSTGLTGRLAGLRHPGAVSSRRRDARRRLRAVPPSSGRATGHVQAADAEAAHVKSQIATIVQRRAEVRRRADLLLRARADVLLGDVLHLHRQGARPSRVAQHRRRRTLGWLRAAGTRSCRRSSSCSRTRTGCSWPTPSAAVRRRSTVAARPGWSTMTAVRKGQVVGLNDDIASRWGPRIVELLRTVETAMSKHPAGT